MPTPSASAIRYSRLADTRFGAVLVFLHLLEGDGTDLPGEIALTEAELYAAQFDASAYVDVEPLQQGLRDRPLFPAFPLLPRCKQKKRPGTHAAAGQDFTSMCSSQSTATDVLTQPTRTMCRIMRAARSRSRPCSG